MDANLELGLAAQREVAEELMEHLEDRRDTRGLRLLEILLDVEFGLLKSTCAAWQKRLDEN